MVTRRAFLGLWGTVLPLSQIGSSRASEASNTGCTQQDLLDFSLARSAGGIKRTTVIVPKAVPADVKLPVLVLLHGLGETSDERMGAHAWVERYGLMTSSCRLLSPPVDVGIPTRFLTASRAAEINGELASRAFQPLIVVCPHTPNVYNARNTQVAIDTYADWIGNTLLPEVRRRVPAATGDFSQTGIDGCSLGGFLSLEVFLRKPGLFGTCGGVQSAIGAGSAVRYASRFETVLKDAGKRAIHLETSLGDTFHDGNKKLAKELERKGIACTLRVPPGPHNQPWLKEVGTLEMLLWHSRMLWDKKAG